MHLTDIITVGIMIMDTIMAGIMMVETIIITIIINLTSMIGMMIIMRNDTLFIVHIHQQYMYNRIVH